MGLFHKDKRTPAQKNVDKIYADQNREKDSAMIRQKKITRCYIELKRCDRYFDDTILNESATAAKLEESGFVAQAQRDRIKQAAMGRIVVKRALIELETVATEQQLNSAINLLGTAIRQMNRLSNVSTEGISKRSRDAINSMLPESEKAPGGRDVFDLVSDDDEPIPPEIADRVNEAFVKDLMDGRDFDECLRSSGHTAKTDAEGKPVPDSKKYADILRQNADKK